MGLRIAVTADLHWGHRTGAGAVLLLSKYLHAEPPDVLVLAGDLGVGDLFDDCLALFADLPGLKAVTPGNHDLWVAEDAEHDSLRRYEEDLPGACARLGYHYLDRGPLLLPAEGLALVGSINWYDYSWAIEELRRRFPGDEHRLHSKRFTRGRHNDAVFVRWPLDDIQFTARVAAKLEADLRAALEAATQAIVVTHHPPFAGLNIPRTETPLSLDRLLWEAFSGNRTVEELLARHADRIPLAFCGHTHQARESNLGPVRGYNVGGDYSTKRLLLLGWPAGTVTAHEFGDVKV